MNKSLLIGIVAFGGLLLIGTTLNNNDQTDTAVEEIETAASIPAGFTGQFPLYPDSTIANVRESEGDTSRDVSVGLDTTASKDEIHAWYRAELSSDGWSITSDRNVAGYQIIQSEKDNLYTSLQVAGSEEPGTQRISQSLKIRK